MHTSYTASDSADAVLFSPGWRAAVHWALGRKALTERRGGSRPRGVFLRQHYPVKRKKGRKSPECLTTGMTQKVHLESLAPLPATIPA